MIWPTLFHEWIRKGAPSVRARVSSRSLRCEIVRAGQSSTASSPSFMVPCVWPLALACGAAGGGGGHGGTRKQESD